MEVVAGHFFAFMWRNCGAAVISTSIGGRNRISWPPSALRHLRGQPMLTSATHDCVSAALVNAVSRSAAKTRRVAWRKSSTSRRAFTKPQASRRDRQAGEESHVQYRSLLEIEAQAAIKKANRRGAFEFVAAKRASVYVVRLREDACVDQSVVVAANNAVIMDSEETSALRLPADVRTRFGGSKERLLRVQEVRQFESIKR